MSAAGADTSAMAAGSDKADGSGSGGAISLYNSSNYEIDPSITDEERRFYLKAYNSIDLVNTRKVHCTVCRTHIGTAPNAESNIKMHPILRVTHCIKCHEFYNSGEFSKGEDGSELYCRWCGQGGEVYCCSNCPFVFCKSCIVKNLSRGVVADIEQNENWNCFKCAPKILWPLRALHWALINYIDTQKKQCIGLNDTEMRILMAKDGSQCCRLAKAKASSMSDSLESLESNASKRSQASGGSSKKTIKPPLQTVPAKRLKLSNDEVVCTPDLLSMLEPDCQLTVTPKSRPPVATPPMTSVPKIVTTQSEKSIPPPPLVLSNNVIRMRQIPNQQQQGRTLVFPRGPQTPQPVKSPVYHTVSGYRIDLNSASQRETFRLPNGKLIQVKRQGAASMTQQTSSTPGQLVIRRAVPNVQRPGPGPIRPANHCSPNVTMPLQQQQQTPNQSGVMRISSAQSAFAATSTPPQPPAVTSTPLANGAATPQGQQARPQVTRYLFHNDAVGQGRTQLQDQLFNTLDIATHLHGKLATLSNSHAYTQVKSIHDIKELYIHLSYLQTYIVGRLKDVQDKCLVDMRKLGFNNDADCLENGQLAAAVDYVCYGQLLDVDLFNTGPKSFHNQVYDYRKSLHANLKEGEAEPLPPLVPIGVGAERDPEDDIDENDNNENDDWMKEDDNDNEIDNDNDDDGFLDNDDQEGDDNYKGYESTMDSAAVDGTEESMTRNEQSHAYDRKLTRLLREYPSIWCTKHPDYGNFEVTRKHWRVVASHFKRNDNIKHRWKNIRKRFVRIERRTKQGKRFHGYFDKATNYLVNRDLPESEWFEVDCGEDDGDVFERKDLDAIEDSLHEGKRIDDDNVHFDNRKKPPPRPIEVRPIDERIIYFAKNHPVLWRKSVDPKYDSIDEQTRKSLWANFWKSMPNKNKDDIIDNEIEIVEPKTDTITIDSDNEDESAKKSSPIAKLNLNQTKKELDVDFTASILASMLDVEPSSSSTRQTYSSSSVSSGAIRKQPRKKTTNKPNPALLQLERERQDEIKRNDAKLKKRVVIKLVRAECQFPFAKQWIEAQGQLKLSGDENQPIVTKNKSHKEKSNNLKDTSNKEISEEGAAATNKDLTTTAKDTEDKQNKTPTVKETNSIASATGDESKTSKEKDDTAAAKDDNKDSSEQDANFVKCTDTRNNIITKPSDDIIQNNDINSEEMIVVDQSAIKPMENVEITNDGDKSITIHQLDNEEMDKPLSQLINPQSLDEVNIKEKKDMANELLDQNNEEGETLNDLEMNQIIQMQVIDQRDTNTDPLDGIEMSNVTENVGDTITDGNNIVKIDENLPNDDNNTKKTHHELHTDLDPDNITDNDEIIQNDDDDVDDDNNDTKIKQELHTDPVPDNIMDTDEILQNDDDKNTSKTKQELHTNSVPDNIMDTDEILQNDDDDDINTKRTNQELHTESVPEQLLEKEALNSSGTNDTNFELKGDEDNGGKTDLETETDLLEQIELKEVTENDLLIPQSEEDEENVEIKDVEKMDDSQIFKTTSSAFIMNTEEEELPNELATSTNVLNKRNESLDENPTKDLVTFNDLELEDILSDDESFLESPAMSPSPS